MLIRFTKQILILGAMLAILSGCTVIKVVDVAASTTVGAAKGAAKVTGKVAGAAIPDGDDKDKD